MTTIKCPNCGVYNTDRDYCEKCQTLLSYKIRRELAIKKEKEERLKQASLKEKESYFFEEYLNHRFLLVRIIANIFRSIWLVFVAIGMFFAWFMTTIVA